MQLEIYPEIAFCAIIILLVLHIFRDRTPRQQANQGGVINNRQIITNTATVILNLGGIKKLDEVGQDLMPPKL